MSNGTATAIQATQTLPEKRSAIVEMANRLNVDPTKLLHTLQQTAFKGANNEEMMALVVVANAYKLNPFLKQIYAFPQKGGGIVPIVSVDGWLSIINSHPNNDGLNVTVDQDENGKPTSATCTIWVKDRQHPIEITEYFIECNRNTDPWRTMPRRMLRHKAIMQCARVAFGLGGIYDEDEGMVVAANSNSSGGVSVSVAPVETVSRAAALVDKLQRPVEPSPAQEIPSELEADAAASEPLPPEPEPIHNDEQIEPAFEVSSSTDAQLIAHLVGDRGFDADEAKKAIKVNCAKPWNTLTPATRKQVYERITAGK